MAKKWYNLFVQTERPEEPGSKNPAQRRERSAGAPKRAADLVPAEETRFARPVADPTVFDDIYAAAQIVEPAHGFTILKIAQMLESEHLSGLPLEVKRKSILVALDAAKVPLNDVVEDAVRRDQALDTYERVLEKALTDTRAESQSENQRLEAEIEQHLAQLRAGIDANNERLRQEEASLESWRARKKLEENRIAEAVQPFVSENPVTTANAPATPHGGDHVR